MHMIYYIYIIYDMIFVFYRSAYTYMIFKI